MRWLKTGFLSIDKTFLFSSVLFQEKATSGVGTPASEWSQASPPAHSYYANHSLQTGRLCRRFAWF